jgi:hypothetical protein
VPTRGAGGGHAQRDRAQEEAGQASRESIADRTVSAWPAMGDARSYMLVAPFRVFGCAARPATFPPRGVLSGFAARSEFRARRSTAVIGWAIPLCRWPFPRLCGFPSSGHADYVKQPAHPLFEFRVPPESCPAQPSPPAAAGERLSWALFPYSARGLGDPLAAGGAGARYGPPSGFGYPLGGLRPPRPCRFCFTPAALMGFTLRSFLLPEGIRAVSGGKHPRTVSLVGNPAAEAMGRPNEPRFPGFDPSESPWRPDA